MPAKIVAVFPGYTVKPRNALRLTAPNFRSSILKQSHDLTHLTVIFDARRRFNTTVYINRTYIRLPDRINDILRPNTAG